MKKNSSSGFAMIAFILVSILLMGSLAAVMSTSTRQASKPMRIKSITADIIGQAQLIRTRISQCALEYPAGDNGQAGQYRQYPQGEADISAASGAAVSALLCPGASTGAQDLWSGTEGVFLPKTPDGFNAWEYYNSTVSGILIRIRTPRSENGIALQKAAEKYTSSEAAYAIIGSDYTFTLYIKK